MKRLLFIVGVCFVTLVMVLSVDIFFFGFLHPFGCDYKGLHLKKSDGGENVALQSKYSYEQMFAFVTNNTEYTVSDNGKTQFYVTKNIGALDINLLVNKNSAERVTYNMNLYGTKSRTKSNSNQGADCNIANYIISRNVNDFITGLHLPKDLEHEILESYYPISVVNYQGFL
jgi:hypothetical protein